MHSTVSDGSLPPDELMRLAAASNVTTLALTDHDSTAGLAVAEQSARELGLDFIRGVELSSRTEYGHVDVLGLWTPVDDPEFEALLDKLRRDRLDRNAAILRKLEHLGLPIDPEALAAFPSDTLGRPHIAGLMLEKGYVKSYREAFDRYLNAGRPAYVPKAEFSPEEAVEALARAGATPVLAHPMLIRCPKDWLEDLVRKLAPLGLRGLEAYHSEHGHAATRHIVDLAGRTGLILSGGSDFHGAPKPHIRLGVGKGGLRVPWTVLDELRRDRVRMNLPV